MLTQPLAQAAVALPGAGSSASFARSAFGPALTAAAIPVICPQPEPHNVIGGYYRALRTASANGPIVIAGISIGAVAALNWALRYPGTVSAVLAALPPWTGAPGDAPAALSARYTAARLRADGLAATIATMQAASPRWLGQTLTESWAALWPGLPAALDEAAGYCAPTEQDLRTLTIPVAIVAATDDPVHPYAVGVQWHQALPQSGLSSLGLGDIGADPAIIGAAALEALPR